MASGERPTAARSRSAKNHTRSQLALRANLGRTMCARPSSAILDPLRSILPRECEPVLRARIFYRPIGALGSSTAHTLEAGSSGADLDPPLPSPRQSFMPVDAGVGLYIMYGLAR